MPLDTHQTVPHLRRTISPLNLALVALLTATLVSCDPERPTATSATVAEPAQPPEVSQASQASQTSQTLMTAAQPMLIVFSRDYCTPCRVMKPWVEEIARENTRIDVVSVNIDRRQYEHLGRFFQVSAVPTLVYADADGRVSARREGLATKKQMIETLRRLGWGG